MTQIIIFFGILWIILSKKMTDINFTVKKIFLEKIP